MCQHLIVAFPRSNFPPSQDVFLNPRPTHTKLIQSPLLVVWQRLLHSRTRASPIPPSCFIQEQHTKTMNVNFLYPVVHDLTEAEYRSGGNSGGCCNPVYACNPTGCFSLEDLIYPESEPVSIPMTEPTREVRQTRGGLFGRNRSRSMSRMIPQSLVEDRNDDTVVRDRRLRYDDVYALTKQVRFVSGDDVQPNLQDFADQRLRSKDS